MKITKEKLAQMYDHSNLRPDATKDDLRKLCEDAKKYGFGAVAVNSGNAKYCKQQLSDADVKVVVGVGYPLGAVATEVKVFETKKAISDGADEIDMVINIGALKDGDKEFVKSDIGAVVEAANGLVTKAIISVPLLTDEEKRIACKMAAEAGANFVKTCSGYEKSTYKPSDRDIRLMKEAAGDRVQVKASASPDPERAFSNLYENLAAIKAGATRLGGMFGVNILKEYEFITRFRNKGELEF